MPKNKKRIIESSSSSDESDIMDIIDKSDSGSEKYTSDHSEENVDNLHADEAIADEPQAGEPEGDQASYNAGDFVLVLFKNNRFPGQITAISDKGTKVDCMKKRSNSGWWPTNKYYIGYK